MAEFLFEIFCEEIPARMQKGAEDQLIKLVREKFDALGVSHQGIDAYSTPRRLVAVAHGVELLTKERVEEKRGPRVGAPDQALQGFLSTNNFKMEDLETRDTGKGVFYFATLSEMGRDTASLIPEVVDHILRLFQWPKSMTWGSHSFAWVRPIQRLMVIFNGQGVLGSFTLEGETQIPFCSHTTGHRFLAPEPITVTTFEGYKQDLESAYVLVDRQARKEKILCDATRLCESIGATLKEDAKLLDEVTGLVEWPVCLWGSIPAAYFDLPQDVLMTSMRVHQKYFSVIDKQGLLKPHFVVVSNQVALDQGEQIIAGNEKVLNARLSDAKFFWDQDRKVPLGEKTERLAGITFHIKLGTMYQKIERLQSLVGGLGFNVPPEILTRAAFLSKTDLVTEMVGEFPELQGIMGGYYAQHDSEDAAVVRAISEHYSPQGPQDKCPSAPVSVALALADKLDTLAGFFLIDEKPTGSKDPYALRRAALGIIRLILENKLRLKLRSLIQTAMDAYALPKRQEAVADLMDFMIERFRVQLKDQGFRFDILAAIFEQSSSDDFTDLFERVKALSTFLQIEDGVNLAAAYRRARNIVHAESQKGGFVSKGAVDAALLSDEAERDLFHLLQKVKTATQGFIKQEAYTEAMTHFATLRIPLDLFFHKVIVNADDAALRQNRLELLAELQRVMEEVADFSQVSKDHS